MHFIHHLLFRNLEHYLAIGSFIHDWREKKKMRAAAHECHVLHSNQKTPPKGTKPGGGETAPS